MRKMQLMLAMLLLCSVMSFAQSRTISGTVRDEKGNPVPFASVQLKGKKKGVSADAEGKFVISAGTGDKIVFTALGLATSEVTVGGDNTLSVTLAASTKDLSEVVVTGAYGTKRTARSTSYNAQVVSSEQLNTIRQTNLNNALAGKVSGLQIRSQSTAKLGKAGSIRLRGASGLGGGEDIIYVVDGTILPDANDINLDDIENVTVLQGPAAAAQFGSQGANGAIVITMKKGNRNAKGLGVDVNIGAQFDKAYILPNYQNSYAGGSSQNMSKYTWVAGQPEEWKALDGKYYHNYEDDASWGPRMVGQEYIPWYAWYGGTKYSYKTANLVPQENNAKEYFANASTLNNTVSFSKATENTSLRFSFGNIYQKGLVPTSYLKKNTMNLNLTQNITSRLILGVNVNYITQKTFGEVGDDADDYSNQTSGSFSQWFHRDLDMGIMKELRGLKTPGGIYASWNHSNPGSYNAADPKAFYAGNYWYNFYTYQDLIDNQLKKDRLYGDLNLTYKITNDLKIKGTYRKQQVTEYGESKYSSDFASSGLQTTGNNPQMFGYYGTYQNNSNRENLEVVASYTKKLNDFQIDATLGTDFFRWISKSNSGETVQGLIFPNLFTLSNSKNPASNGNYRVEEKYRAVYGTGSIGYKNLAFLDFTLRNDWFSTLRQDENDVLSKSFGASFVFSDVLKIPALSFGKLRASWGEIPQALGTTTTSFGAYRYPSSVYGISQYQYNGNALQSTPDVLVDSALTGAVKKQIEVGIDLRFLKNRIGISATYWDGTEQNFPTAITINGANGFTSYLTNAGKLSKKGLDLQFNAKPLMTKDFMWEINATWGRLLKNTVVSVSKDPNIKRTVSLEAAWGATGPYLVHEVGKEWGQMFGNGIKRIDGKPVLTASGAYVNDPAVNFGSVLPKYTGGVQNSFQILKDFTVNVNIDYQVGGKFFSLSDMWGSYSGLTARTATTNDKGVPIRDAVADGGGVKVTGVDADGKDVSYYVAAQTYFQGLYNNKTFDPYIYDLTFVKLREVSIGYNIPVNKIGLGKVINRAIFTLVARNPVLIYAQTKDFDPSELSDIGSETGQLPGTRGLGFNLKVSF